MILEIFAALFNVAEDDLRGTLEAHAKAYARLA